MILGSNPLDPSRRSFQASASPVPPEMAATPLALPSDVYQAIPRHVINEDGKPGDPVNLVVTGSEAQVRQAFERAGWTPAAPLNFLTALKMAFCTFLHLPYDNAPVSSLYLGSDKHRQDMAFERATATTKQRDHVRLWDTGRKDEQGQEVWIAAATRDAGIEMNKRDFGPTHRIDPNVDLERDLAVRTLVQAGAKLLGVADRGAYDGINGEGDRYHTNGQLDILQANP